MRAWQAVAGGAGVVALTVLAPMASGSVWAAVATPADPRIVVGPALLVGEVASDQQNGTADAVTLPDPSATPSGPASTGPSSPAAGASSDDDAPRTLAPDRVRRIDDDDDESHDGPSTEPTGDPTRFTPGSDDSSTHESDAGDSRDPDKHPSGQDDD